MASNTMYVVGILLLTIVLMTVFWRKFQNWRHKQSVEQQALAEHVRITDAAYQARQASAKATEMERRAEIVKHRAEWGDELCRKIGKREIEVGMTMEMVSLAWGEPHDLDEEISAREAMKIKWIYETPRKTEDRYVWFIDDGVINFSAPDSH